MTSKAHLLYKGFLERICKKYDIPLFKELKSGSKKYDFYIPTILPIVIEVDGVQHDNTKVDKFFFKNLEQLQEYRENDNERNFLFKTGKIHLIRIKSNVFLKFSEFIDLLENTGTFELLDKGVDINNAYYRSYERNRRFKEQRKKINRDFKKEKKGKNNCGN